MRRDHASFGIANMTRSRKALWQISQAVRTLSSSSATASVPATSSSSSGLLAFGSKKSVAPSLDIPLADYEQVKAVAPMTAEPPTTVSTLSNGLKVGCQEIQVWCAMFGAAGFDGRSSAWLILCPAAESASLYRSPRQCW